MKRLLIVAYDGTNYCGWQIQNNGADHKFNEALTALFHEKAAGNRQPIDPASTRKVMWLL